jgi:hypothetical protein
MKSSIKFRAKANLCGLCDIPVAMWRIYGVGQGAGGELDSGILWLIAQFWRPMLTN